MQDLAPVAGYIRAALGDMRFWAAAALLPIAHLGGAFIDLGREISARNEQTRISFRVLMGDVQAADALLQKLIDYAALTPFELPQLFNVTQGLIAFGDRGQDVMDTLKMLGDVSGGVHEKFQILGTVFNQIRGVGSLMSQDFKQLSIRGLLFITDIAKYLGVTKEQADHLQRTGQVSFEDVKGTLMMLTQAGGRFHRMMELQSQSIIGLQATLNDNWGIFASKIADSLIPLDRVLLKIKIGLLDAMTDLVDATHGFASGAIVGATAASKLAVALLAAALAARLLRISMRALLFGFGWGVVIVGIGAALGGLVAWFAQTGDGIRATSEVSIILMKAWQNLKDAAAELLRSVGEGFANVFGVDIPALLNELSGSLASIIIYMANLFLYLSEVALFTANGIGFAFRNAWDLLAIGGLDIFIVLIEYLQTLEAVFYQIATVIMKVFVGLWAFLEAGWTNMLNQFKAIGQEMKNQWAWATEFLKAMGEYDYANATARADAARREEEENGFQRPPMLNPLEEALKAAAAEAGLDPGDGIFNDFLEAMKEEQERLQERIDERERNRKEPELPEKEEEPEKKKKEKEQDLPTSIIPAGRYGFIEFGQKIQDAMLKGRQEEQAEQMIGLLGRGVNIQERILNEQQRNRGLAQ